MPIFRVTLSGQKVILKTEEGDQICGFVRNEYVRARNRDEAIEKAKQKARERVSQSQGISVLSDAPLDLVADEVEEGVPIWKLAANESFIFFEIK